jgi:hypothetical protein
MKGGDMGEIAEDCYDRVLDELEMLAMAPGYFESDGYYGGPFINDAEPRIYGRRRPAVATAADFDDMSEPPSDDFSDLV